MPPDDVRFQSEEDEMVVLGRALVIRASLCLKLATMHSLENQAMNGPIADFLQLARAVIERDRRLTLRAGGNNFFLNDDPIRLDAQTFESAESLRRIFARLGVDELVMSREVSEQELRAFLKLFRDRHSSHNEGAAVGTDESIGLRVGAVNQKVDVESKDARQTVLLGYAALVCCIQESLGDLAASHRPRLARIRRAAQAMHDACDGNEALVVGLVNLQRAAGLPVYHLAAVVSLVLLMGKKLGLRKKALADLMMSAAFHDTGRSDLPPPLDEAEYERALGGVRLGTVVHICQSGASLGALRRIAIANEHELGVDVDDGGIPPSAAARLVAVACAYDTMISKHPPGLSMQPEQAVRYILYGAGGRFDPAACKILANVIGLYPIGTTVKLSDGRIAVVVGSPARPENFQRPKVRIVDPKTGATHATLDLALAPPGLVIEGSREPVDLAQVMEEFMRV